jgi:hypothetical protein
MQNCKWEALNEPTTDRSRKQFPTSGLATICVNVCFTCRM